MEGSEEVLPVETIKLAELERDGVADVHDREEAQRSGGVWQDRMGCGCQPQDRKGFTDILKKGRICTDIPWLLAYFVYAIGMFSVVYIPAYINGDADWILKGVDYEKRVCGKSDGVTDRPLAIWPDTSNYQLKMCVADCSASQDSANVISSYESQALGGSWCIPSEDLVEEGKQYCLWKEILVIVGGGLILAAVIGCCMVYASKKHGWCTLVACILMVGGGSTSVYFGVDCGEMFSTSAGSTVLVGVDTFSNVLTKQIGDLYTAIPIIAGSFVFAVVFGFFYIWLMRKAIRCIVWSGICLIIVYGFLTGVVFFYHVSTKEDKSSTMALAEQICGSVAFVATFIFICVVIWLQDRIHIACEVVISSSRAVVELPTIFILPCCPIVTGLLFAFAWLYAQAYVFSTGDWITADMPDDLSGQTNQYEVFPTEYAYLDNMGDLGNATFWLSLLLFLWTINIMVYWAYMVLAGTIADWYFTVRNAEGVKVRGDKINQLAHNPLWSSMKRTTFNHLGSIFYAAFIIAVIQLCRAIIEYLQGVTDKASNPCTKCIFRCIKCALYCVECCCRWIGRNALVWISIFGDCFCESAYAAFTLQWRNLARVAMMSVVSRIVISVGEFAILAVPTGLAGLFLLTVEPYKSDISSIVLPLLIICALNYFVGWIFMEVYETAVDTVFLCFLVDEETNMETGLLADKALREIVDKYKGDSEEIAKRRKQIMGNLDTPRKPDEVEVA